MTERQRSRATRRVRIAFSDVQDTQDRLVALSKSEGLSVESLLSEAVYIHLHRLESAGDPKLRRKSVCWSCGNIMDAAADGTMHARCSPSRKKP